MTKSDDDTGEMRKTSLYVPVEAAEIVKNDPEKDYSGSMQRGLRAEAYGEQVVEAEEKNDVAREQREQTLSEIEETIARFEDSEAFSRQQVVDELETLRESIDDNVERQIHARQQQATEDSPTRENERLEECLADLDSILSRGENVFSGHGKVEKAVEVSGVSGPEEVIDLLKERHPNLPESRFEAGSSPVHRVGTDGGESR